MTINNARMRFVAHQQMLSSDGNRLKVAFGTLLSFQSPAATLLKNIL
jgi:hypothetical protein